MALTKPVVRNQTITQLTQSDLYSRLDPDGRVAQIAEVLNETNEMLQDIPYKEGNLPTGHRVSIRTGLPVAYWKQMNRGVPSSKSTTAQVEETCGMCQARSIIDKQELELNGNTLAYRQSEDVAFIEAMNQTMQTTLFYGDAGKQYEGFTGFATRYGSLKAENSKNIIDCGGTGNDLTSIWIIGWGDNTVHGIYPKGTKVGLDVEDKGEQRVLDADGNPYYAYETLYSWANGLVVKDWRYVVRLANIKVSDLKKGTGLGTGDIKAGNNLITTINEGLAKFPTQGKSKICIYMNGEVHQLLSTISMRSNANVITIQQGINEYGNNMTWTSFMGYPMRRVDQLKLNEAQVQ